MQGQNEELKKKATDQENQIKRIVTEYENKVGILKDECERLNSLVEKRNAEIRTLGGDVEEANKGMRLSTQQNSKLTH